MFVMNVKSLIDTLKGGKELDDESIPVIHHVDSSPGGQPPNGNDPSIFVYSLLNWLARGKKMGIKN